MQVNMGEAKAQLSSPARPGRRTIGQWKGKVWIAPDFDETPQEIIDAFEGRCGQASAS